MLSGWSDTLALLNAGVEPMPVEGFLDTDSGITKTSEEFGEQLQRHCPGTALTQPYTREITVQVVDRRNVGVALQTCHVDLTVTSEWDDVRMTCRF